MLGGAGAVTAVAQWVLAGVTLAIAADHVLRPRRVDRRLNDGIVILALGVSVTLVAAPIVAAGDATASEVALWLRMLSADVAIIATVFVIGRVLELRPRRWPLLGFSALLVLRAVLLATGSYVERFTDGGGPVYGPSFAYVNGAIVAAGSAWLAVMVRDLRRHGGRSTMGALAPLWFGLGIVGVAVLVPGIAELGLSLAIVPLLLWATFATYRLDQRETVARERAEQAAAALGLQLQRAQVELAQAEAIANDLVDASQHELRTPLTVILGGLELLQRGDDGIDTAMVVDLVERNARRMHELVEYLLAVRADRWETGGTPRREAVPLTTAIRTCRSMHPALAMQAEIAEDAVPFCDPLDVVTIVQALVSNAERHGGPDVHLRAHRTDGEVHIEVVDDGPGVEESFVPRLFDAFTQPTTGLQRSSTGGLGLGLAVARRRARANGGDLAYERVEDATCFRLTLPAAEARDRTGAGRSLPTSTDDGPA